MRLNQNGSVSGVNKPGIGLVELMLAIALLGVVAAIVVPNLTKKNPKEVRKRFFISLNAFTKFAWQKAVITGKVQRVEFDLDAKRVTMMESSGKLDQEGKPGFQPVRSDYIKTTLKIPATFSFKNFYVESFDEMARSTVSETGAVWFYIVPEGLSQSVIINLVDISDKVGGKGRPVGLVLNPFSAQFKVYDVFKTP